MKAWVDLARSALAPHSVISALGRDRRDRDECVVARALAHGGGGEVCAGDGRGSKERRFGIPERWNRAFMLRQGCGRQAGSIGWACAGDGRS